MYQEDHAPVTLSEIYHQAASCQRAVELAGESNRIFEPFLPFGNLQRHHSHRMVLATRNDTLSFEESDPLLGW